MIPPPAERLREIRQHIDGELSLGRERPLTDAEWRRVGETGAIADYEAHRASVYDVVRDVRSFRGCEGPDDIPTRRPQGTRQRARRGTPTALRETRNRVVSEILATMGEKDENVRAFRSKFLGGTTLPPAQVETWVTEKRNQGESEILAQLRVLGRDLSVYTWDWRAAVWFVLTGEQPRVDDHSVGMKIASDLPVLSRLTVTVDPSLTPPEVASIYRAARQKQFGGRFRRLSEKHLELARFAAVQPADTSWDRQLQAWNRECRGKPKWRFDHVCHFKRAAEIALRRVLRLDADVLGGHIHA